MPRFVKAATVVVLVLAAIVALVFGPRFIPEGNAQEEISGRRCHSRAY